MLVFRSLPVPWKARFELPRARTLHTLSRRERCPRDVVQSDAGLSASGQDGYLFHCR